MLCVTFVRAKVFVIRAVNSALETPWLNRVSVYMCTFDILVDEVFNTLNKHNGGNRACDDVLRAMEFFVQNKKRRFVVPS